MVGWCFYVHEEELAQERGRGRRGVQLAAHGDHDVEVHATQVPELVGVQPARLGPLAHAPHHDEEGLVALRERKCVSVGGREGKV